MSNIYFSSDWHLFHKKIQEYCPFSRKGNTPEQMTKMILENISSQTKPGDVIYNMGDVSFGSFDQTLDVLSKIKKMRVAHHLVLGNHDHKIRKDQVLQSKFDSVADMNTITITKQVIVMCHFSMSLWDRKHYGAWHLFGHSHGGYQVPGKSMDVGIDTRPCGDMTMWSFEEVKQIMDRESSGKHH